MSSYAGFYKTTTTKVTTKEYRAGRKLVIYHVRQDKSMQEDQDQASAVTYFCIHGAMAQHGQFLELVDELQKGATCADVVLYDALGCGESAKLLPSAKDPKPYSTNALLLDALDVFNGYCKTRKNVVLIGHSYGSAVVARLFNVLQTANGAQNIKALVLISTYNEFPADAFKIFDWYPVWLLQCLQGSMSRNFVKIAFSPKTDKETRKPCLDASNLNSMAVCKVTTSEYSQLHSSP
jgi:pimeloyl-ACP methyl ester carboxylesterase